MGVVSLDIFFLFCKIKDINKKPSYSGEREHGSLASEEMKMATVGLS